MSNQQRTLPECGIKRGTRLTISIDGELKSVMTKADSYFEDGVHMIHVSGFGISEAVPVSTVMNSHKVKGWRVQQVDDPTLLSRLVRQLSVMTQLVQIHCPDEKQTVELAESLLQQANNDLGIKYGVSDETSCNND